MTSEREKKPARKEVILHICHQCMGFYLDGKDDCKNISCPAYCYMPYGQLEPDYSWRKHSPLGMGIREKKPGAKKRKHSETHEDALLPQEASSNSPSPEQEE